MPKIFSPLRILATGKEDTCTPSTRVTNAFSLDRPCLRTSTKTQLPMLNVRIDASSVYFENNIVPKFIIGRPAELSSVLIIDSTK